MPIYRVIKLENEYAIKSENRVTHEENTLVGRYASFQEALRDCIDLNRADQDDQAL